MAVGKLRGDADGISRISLGALNGQAQVPEKSHSRIVRALAHVDVVVRVDRRLAAQLSSHDLDGSVRDDLVDVHVGLRTRPGLEDNEGEVVDEFTGNDLVRGLADGVGDLLVHA